MKEVSPVLPLTHALGWIVGSLFVTVLIWNFGFRQYTKFQMKVACDPKYAITHIIQTGPQKEALKTEYLAELLGLSHNGRVSSLNFGVKKAEEKLLKSPLIQDAHVKIVAPHTLYIDYAIRQPIVWFYDYHNVALDKHAVPIPFTPFFAPKNLPEIYLGIDPSAPISWSQPLVGKEITLAFEILHLIQDPKIRDLLPLKRIDVSHAFSKNAATREVVLMIEDEVVQKKGLQEVRMLIPRILRLSPKRYSQELGNYLKLREKLLQQESLQLKAAPDVLGQPVLIQREKPKVIDFRLENLAFIDGQK